MIKAIVIGLLLAVIASLGSGLYYLIKDRGKGDRVVRALTLRVAISIGLLVLLGIGIVTGWWVPPL